MRNRRNRSVINSNTRKGILKGVSFFITLAFTKHFIMKTNSLVLLLLFFCASNINAQKSNYSALISTAADKIESKVIAWRHDIHEHPELGNHEVRTAALIAKHLQSLGIEVKTGVGITGVVGILKGDKPGPVVALRADMDALPVEEKNN